MKKRGDLGSWWYWQLLKEKRRPGKHAVQAEKIRCEIQRRREKWEAWGAVIAATCGIIIAIVTVARERVWVE